MHERNNDCKKGYKCGHDFNAVRFTLHCSGLVTMYTDDVIECMVMVSLSTRSFSSPPLSGRRCSDSSSVDREMNPRSCDGHLTSGGRGHGSPAGPH